MMLKEEFEKRTGIYPSEKMYCVIEKHYNNFDGDKDEFCAAYLKNRDNLAVKIQMDADLQDIHAAKEMEQVKGDYEDQITKLNEALAQVRQKLDKELEWEPYEIPENVPQEDYDELKDSSVTTIWSDQKATEFLSLELGFAKDRIQIIRTAPVYEINRHRHYREVGTVERLPLYAASDWNYIRFDCACRQYEYYNGELRFFCE